LISSKSLVNFYVMNNFLYNSYVFIEYHTNGYKDETLLILSLLSIVLSVLVIISKNPIISVLFLIGLFMTISFYLMFLGLNFLGISYLLVYIGAVSILFLFILMLINIRISEILSDTYNSIVLSIMLTIYFSIIFRQTSDNVSKSENYSSELDKYFNISVLKLDIEEDISHVYYNSWDNNMSNITYINNIGNILYTNYSIWLILTSIILLLAMVGCIIVTIKQNKSINS